MRGEIENKVRTCCRCFDETTTTQLREGKTKRYRARHQTGNELLNKKTTAVVSCALPFQFGSSQTFGRLSVLVLTIFSINYMAVAIAIRLFSPYITLCASCRFRLCYSFYFSFNMCLLQSRISRQQLGASAVKDRAVADLARGDETLFFSFEPMIFVFLGNFPFLRF